MRRLAKFTAIFVLTIFWAAVPAWPWGTDGHRIVARIAAMSLSAITRQKVARLLGVSSDPNAVADAMADASIWPDTVLRDLDPDTKSWHFLDICMDDSKEAVGEHCPKGGCVTQKIEEYRSRLQRGRYDKWGGKGDLSLLIHFVGDIHQPLHCASNADRGGNCVRVDFRSAVDLHGLWDNEIVQQIEDELRAGTEGVSFRLAQELQRNPSRDSFSWKTGSAKDIAWESHQLAESRVYLRLGIPKQSCLTVLQGCDAAPQGIRDLPIPVDAAYVEEAASVARTQLMRGGVRLAELLNLIWP
jgi:hypothetical protein